MAASDALSAGDHSLPKFTGYPLARCTMTEEERTQRDSVVKIAKEYLRTPYHHEARVKGQGVDCATLLAGIFEEAGLLSHIEIPPYSASWHLHREEEKYLNFIRQFGGEVEFPPNPGDIVVWRFHRCFSHGAIVIQWPIVIHAFMAAGMVVEEDVDRADWLTTVGERTAEQGQPRRRKFLSYWAKT